MEFLNSKEVVFVIAGLILTLLAFRAGNRGKSDLRYKNERLNEQIDDARDKAVSAEETAQTKELFLATMSHEIRTPLNCLNGLSEVLLSSDPRPDQEEYLKTISKSTEALLTILTNVLDYTKINAGQFEINPMRFSLSEVTEEIHSLFKEEASRKDIIFEFNQDSDKELQVFCDRNCLRQALLNLVSNAIKYTDKGHIQMEVFFQHHSNKGSKQMFEIALQVADTGIGIDPEKADQLFKPFHQLVESKTRKYEGTGLGLSISKFMVESGLGGSIHYEPSEVGGSRFNIQFVAEAFVTSKNKVGQNLSAASLLKTSLSQNIFELNVLVVDDNALNCLTMKAMLEKMGHRADFATDGLKAQEQLKKDNYNLIFMDIMMPNVDGLEATAAIRKGACGDENKSIPIVATTAFANAGDRERFIKAGMNYYISKPVDPDQMRNILTTTGRELKKEQKVGTGNLRSSQKITTFG
ncbi:MAG: response regulator [Verrucomicrobiota bacterium]